MANEKFRDKRVSIKEGKRLYILLSLILLFEQKAPRFHFGLSSANYVASAGHKLVLPISLIYC